MCTCNNLFGFIKKDGKGAALVLKWFDYRNFSSMKYEFEQNEFTSWELLEYMKLAYGSQLNGSAFTSTNLQNWIRQRRIPDLYGGFKIIGVDRYKELNNLLVLSLDGFTRNEAEALVGSLSSFEETVNKRRKLERIKKSSRPLKHRTKFYFKLLPKSKQYTRKLLEQSTLPDFWKDAGIKRNQMVKGRKKKV